MRVVFVDNFDSFTYNLVEYVSEQRLGEGSRPETTVLKNTASLAAVRAADPDAVIVSPGPGRPENERDVGVSPDVVRELGPSVPTLGVCLGMESVVHEFGGEVGTAPKPVHGKASPVEHDGEGIFEGLDQGFQAGRYHSLAAIDVPDALAVSATTEQGGESIPMAIRHREHPIVGVQFHPESVLTAAGHRLIENFLALASDRDQRERVEGRDDHGGEDHDLPGDPQHDPTHQDDERERHQREQQATER